jgi:hypothetical protein
MMTSLRLHENCVLDLMFFDYFDIEEKNNVYFGSQMLKGRYIMSLILNILCERERCLLEIGNVNLLESKVKGMFKNQKLMTKD